MARVKAFIWHSVTGEVIAVGRPMGDTRAIPLPGEDQGVLEAELDSENLADLRSTHLVDVERGQLVRQGQDRPSAE